MRSVVPLLLTLLLLLLLLCLFYLAHVLGSLLSLGDSLLLLVLVPDQHFIQMRGLPVYSDQIGISGWTDLFFGV